MRVLALDTTTRGGSAAVLDDTRVLAEMRGDESRSHAERLPGDLLSALERADLSVNDIDIFAVASGPGSFTGLRIGIATMQGLAFATAKPIVAVSALLALAAAAAADASEGTIVAAWMDAHRGDVFSASYRVGSGDLDATGRLVPLAAPEVGNPEQIWEGWAARGERPAIVSGDGAIKFRAVASGARIDAPPVLAPIVGALARQAAARGEAVHPAAVQPLYVRRPDAVIAREARRQQ